jgi:hypothetical protein
MPHPILHPLNFFAGWGLILVGFLCGAGIGLFFHREDFWGGYTSFRRRIVRLGHIALVALGLINVVFAISVPADGSAFIRVASMCFVAGAVAMPAVCFLSGWRQPMRHLFFIPVVVLVAAVVFTLLGATQ